MIGHGESSRPRRGPKKGEPAIIHVFGHAPMPWRQDQHRVLDASGDTVALCKSIADAIAITIAVNACKP